MGNALPTKTFRSCVAVAGGIVTLASASVAPVASYCWRVFLRDAISAWSASVSACEIFVVLLWDMQRRCAKLILLLRMRLEGNE